MFISKPFSLAVQPLLSYGMLPLSLPLLLFRVRNPSLVGNSPTLSGENGKAVGTH
jgi:hypothetical protein